MIFTLTPEGLAVFPACLLGLLLLVLMPMGSRAPAAGYFRGFLLFGALFLIALLLELVSEEPFRRRAAAVQYVALVLAFGFCTQFAYRFIAWPRSYEPALAVAGFALGLGIVLLSLFPLLDSNRPSDAPLQWMNLIVLLGFIWTVSVFVRQGLRFKPWAGLRSRQSLHLSPDATTAFAFALVLMIPVGINVALIAFESHFLERFTFHVLNSAGILIFLALLSELFLRWHRRVEPERRLLIDPRGLRVLMVLLTLCGVANLPLISWYRLGYDEHIADKVVQVEGLLRAGMPSDAATIPEPVAFVILIYPKVQIVFSSGGPVSSRLVLREALSLQRRHSETSSTNLQKRNPSLELDSTRLLNQRYSNSYMRALKRRFETSTFYLGTETPQFHCVFLFVGDKDYLVAFPYAVYQRYLRELLGFQALWVFGGSTLTTALIVGHGALRRRAQVRGLHELK